MTPEVLAGTIWIAVFAVMLVWEMLSLGLTSIWFCGGAIVAAIAGFLGANWYVQVILFIIVSAVLLIALRPIAKRKLIPSTTPTNIDRNIGSRVKILEAVNPGEGTGRIKIDGVEWRAVSESGRVLPKDSFAEIVKIEGTKVYLKEVNE